MSNNKICYNCKFCVLRENGYLWCVMSDCNTYTTDTCNCFKLNEEEGEQ